MKTFLFAVLMLTSAMAWAQRYSLSDAGEFEPLGQRVEFYDRFGWKSYKVDDVKELVFFLVYEIICC